MASNIITTVADEQYPTQNYFESLYANPDFVDENLYEAVIAYFQTIAQGQGAAESLSAAFLDACRFGNRDPLLTLDQLKQFPDSEQYDIILVLLNSIRVGTSMLGKTVINPPNKYALRQVVF
jgi:hypothetical protein